MAKTQKVALSREEELKVLKARNEEIRRNPEFGFKLLQRAGIYNEKRELTEQYREQ